MFREILSDIEQFAAASTDLTDVQRFTVDAIATRLPRYDWVGFYMLAPDDRTMLVLGPFHGAPTEHVRIPVAQGICGAAVAQGETIVVDDVTADLRYLACSIDTHSEIVVPIRVHGEIVGEIDIDSHTPAAFGAKDRSFVEECAALVGRLLERSASYASLSK
ncbi:MAG: GAF domain-containing protein [Edaphobacter sp.]